MKHLPSLTLLAAALVLSGCASVGIDEATRDANITLKAFTAGQLVAQRTDAQRRAASEASAQLLAQPLTQGGAVQLALANSPAVQALLAQSEADLASASQSGRVGNPKFTFERMRFGEELEIGRLLSFGLLELLTLPQRQGVARSQTQQARVQLAANVVDQVSQVRQAWVRAVAAQQILEYARQVNSTAQASAELARRMQQVGNFSKLQRARQHAFYADATAQLALASHAATASREELVRQLGLNDEQAAQLTLPPRLPDVPAEPLAAPAVNAAALQQRLDVQLARAQLDGAGKAQGLDLTASLVDVEMGLRRDTVFDNRAGTSTPRKGYELGIRLPLFDWGTARRDAMNAQTLAAAYRYDGVLRAASSQLREGYSAYRTAHDLSHHYTQEIVPLRKLMAEENLLRYNGMLIGVFELLAETREQIASVMAAINAQQQFWLADAALAAAMTGRPLAPTQGTLP